MATVKMFTYLFFMVLLAVVSWRETQGLPEEYTGNFDKSSFWVPCNYTEVPGATCVGCKEQLICSKLGGIVVPCWFAARPYCVNGSCSAEPSPECGPVPLNSEN